MFKIRKQAFNSVVISAKTQEELSESFMRFQEHYESPVWADKIFTIGQFKQWYSKTYGADTYRHDWSGFNFPSCVLKPFRDGLFDPLTKNEKEILNLLRYRTDEFYIIGSNTNKVLKHELCHALYHFNSEYKQSVNEFLEENKQDIKKALDHLSNLGYHKKVLEDEFQAYVLDDDYFEKNDIVISKKIKDKIKQLHKVHSKK
jgi:hypothetical protein